MARTKQREIEYIFGKYTYVYSKTDVKMETRQQNKVGE